MSDYEARKQSIGFHWFRSDSGNSYLCPSGFDAAGASERELRQACRDESNNPQND